jgi:periplasmic divalent cation tolerance protein
MDDARIVVLITVPSAELGQKIARELVEKRLAACVNILPPMRSIYTWEGRIMEEDEILLLCKTRMELFEDRLIPAVRALHPYQVPEILALPVQAGLKEYIDWIGDVCA